MITNILDKYDEFKPLFRFVSPKKQMQLLIECNVINSDNSLTPFGEWLTRPTNSLFAFVKNKEIVVNEETPLQSFLRLAEYLNLEFKNIININDVNVGDVLLPICFCLDGKKNYLKPIFILRDKSQQSFGIRAFRGPGENNDFNRMLIKFLKKCKWMPSNHYRRFNELQNRSIIDYSFYGSEVHYTIYYGHMFVGRFYKNPRMGSKNKQSIVQLLSGGESLGVGEISSRLGLSRSSVSNNIASLYKDGIITLSVEKGVSTNLNSPKRKYKLSTK